MSSPSTVTTAGAGSPCTRRSAASCAAVPSRVYGLGRRFLPLARVTLAGQRSHMLALDGEASACLLIIIFSIRSFWSSLFINIGNGCRARSENLLLRGAVGVLPSSRLVGFLGEIARLGVSRPGEAVFVPYSGACATSSLPSTRRTKSFRAWAIHFASSGSSVVIRRTPSPSRGGSPGTDRPAIQRSYPSHVSWPCRRRSQEPDLSAWGP